MNKRIVCSILMGGLMTASAWGQNQKAPDNARLIASIQGPALYKAYCAVCHGEHGKGDGPMGSSLKLKVADLTHIAARSAGKFPRMKMERIILGEEMTSGHGTREMPLWGPVFSEVGADQDLGRVRVDNLARFIESLQAK